MVFSRLQASLDRLRSTAELPQRPKAKFFDLLARSWGRKGAVSFRSDVEGGLDEAGPFALSPRRKKAKAQEDKGKGKDKGKAPMSASQEARRMEGEEDEDEEDFTGYQSSQFGTQQASQDSIAPLVGSQPVPVVVQAPRILPGRSPGRVVKKVVGAPPGSKAKGAGASSQQRQAKAMKGF